MHTLSRHHTPPSPLYQIPLELPEKAANSRGPSALGTAGVDLAVNPSP